MNNKRLVYQCILHTKMEDNKNTATVYKFFTVLFLLARTPDLVRHRKCEFFVLYY
jgi:hypothetical protein